jgi:putative superfamily III holin-X
MMADKLDNRSLGDLFAELSRETRQLVRKEFELATTELTAKVKKAGRQVGIAAAGGALVHAGLLVLLAAIVVGLSAVIAPWLSALIVGVATMAIGYVLVNRGLTGLRETRIVPTQTIDTLKEDARWTTRQGA